MRAGPRRVYADTSVFGGCFDPEFEVYSKAFLRQVRAGRFGLLVSVLVADELVMAPPHVQDVLHEHRPWIEDVVVSAEAEELALAFIDAGVVTPKWSADALHVALAVVSEAEVIVSWNFRHIVNFEKIRLYNDVSALRGYRTIAIHSPREVLHYEQGS